jgi:hypothetical protein
MKKIILLPILALLILGCCGILPWFSSKDEFEMIPKTANAVVIIKPSSILNDSDFESLSSSEIDNEIKQAEETTGMDPEKIDRLILFFKLDSLSQQSVTYTGFIAKGAIDKDKVLEKMGQDNTVNELNYDNRVIYEMSPKEMPQNKSYFTFIGGNILTGGDVLIGGTKEAVEDSIDVDAGKGESIKSRGNLSKIYDRFDKNSIFIFMIESSQDVKQSMNTGAGPLNLSALSHTDSLGLSANKAGKSIDFKLMLLADGATGANSISKLLEKSISFAKGLSESGSSLENILTKIKIETTGSEVSVSLSSTVDELRNTYEELGATSPPG